MARVDLRGTGSSEGVATDEYPASEQADLCQVIAWLAAQSWSTGSVGMYGTATRGCGLFVGIIANVRECACP